MRGERSFHPARYIEKRDREIVALARLVLSLVSSTSNILIAIEELKKFFPKLQLIVVDNDLLPNEEARAYPKRWIIKIRKGIHEGLLRGYSRGRWTLIHELGHVLLRHPGKPARPRLEIEDEKTAAGRREREAQKFTRSVLLPFDRYSELSADEIKKVGGVSTKTANRRVLEFSETKVVRDAILRRGLDLRSFTSEFGHRRDIEFQTALVAHTLAEAISPDSTATLPPQEVIQDNLISTSVLVAAASGLLFDAYGSVRGDGNSPPYVRSAVLAIAMANVSPLRHNGNTTRDGFRANRRYALKAAMKLAELPLSEVGAQSFFWHSEKDDPCHCAFLNAVRRLGEKLIVDRSTVLTLEDFPTYELYNSQNDIVWQDVQQIEYLAGIFLMLARASHEPVGRISAA